MMRLGIKGRSPPENGAIAEILEDEEIQG